METRSVRGSLQRTGPPLEIGYPSFCRPFRANFNQVLNQSDSFQSFITVFSFLALNLVRLAP
jgi:hypothetical protein